MLKKDKEELSVYIQKIAKQLSINKNFKMDLIDTLKNRIEMNKLTSLFNTKEDEIVLLNEKDVYWVTKFILNNKSKYDLALNVKIEDYYTDLEINECELHFIKITEEKEDMFILENVVRVNDGEFLCWKAEYQVIADSYNKGILTYNFQTQRQAVYKDIGIAIVQKPREYKKSILEIEKAIVDGTFIPNMITWNILNTYNNDENDIFEYDEENQRMIIFLNKKSRINIIDGFHRTRGITRAIEKNPNAQGHMQIKIFNYDILKAQQFILQENKSNRLEEEKQKTLEQSNEMIVSKMINDYGNKNINAVFGMLSESTEEVFKFNSKFCLLSSISEVLEDCVVLKKRSDNKKVMNHLVKSFNSFIEMADYAFEDISLEQSRSEYVLTYNNFFILLTY